MAASSSTILLQPLPPDVAQAVELFKQLNGRLDEINAACRDLKKNMGHKQTTASLQPVKEILFNYMSNYGYGGKKTLQGITLAKVKPSDVKSSEREEKMTQRVQNVLLVDLSQQLQSLDLEEIVTDVVAAALNKPVEHSASPVVIQ
jgi:hypothetical protein